MRRINLVRSQLQAVELSKKENSLKIIDNRTGNYINSNFLIFLGKEYTFKLNEGVIKASDLEKIKDENGKVLRSYDPAFMNTICCVN